MGFICDICGSSEFKEVNDKFVCKVCGAKYKKEKFIPKTESKENLEDPRFLPSEEIIKKPKGDIVFSVNVLPDIEKSLSDIVSISVYKRSNGSFFTYCSNNKKYYEGYPDLQVKEHDFPLEHFVHAPIATRDDNQYNPKVRQYIDRGKIVCGYGKDCGDVLSFDLNDELASRLSLINEISRVTTNDNKTIKILNILGKNITYPKVSTCCNILGYIIKACKDELEDPQKKYHKGCVYFGKDTLEDLEKAKDEFTNLVGYKDSDIKLAETLKKIEVKKALIEKARQKAEKKQQRKKKNNKLLTTILIIILLIAGGYGYLYFKAPHILVNIKGTMKQYTASINIEDTYNQVKKFIISKITNTSIVETSVEEYINSGDYKSALELYEEQGLTDKVEELKHKIYEEAKTNFDEGRISKANELIALIPNYDEASSLIESINEATMENYYTLGIEKLESFSYDSAYYYFNQIPGYKDADNYSVYSKALYDAGTTEGIPGAYEALKTLPEDFIDTKEKLDLFTLTKNYWIRCYKYKSVSSVYKNLPEYSLVTLKLYFSQNKMNATIEMDNILLGSGDLFSDYVNEMISQGTAKLFENRSHNEGFNTEIGKNQVLVKYRDLDFVKSYPDTIYTFVYDSEETQKLINPDSEETTK